MTDSLRQIIKGFMGWSKFRISRVRLVAKAVSSSEVDSEYFRKLARTFRNPGLLVVHLSDKTGEV